MRLWLPFPPSVNHYWRRVGAKTLISQQGRVYRTRVCDILRAKQVERVEGRLSVEIWAYPPDHRRRDLDNLTKALLDALAHGGAYEDDSQIDHLVIHRCGAVEGGMVDIHISREGCNEEA